MDLEDLKAYIAVAEHQGFRRAADALFVSQPSLTRRVSRLEGELGVPLLVRGRHGVHTTVQGQAFLSSARRVLATVEDAKAEITGEWAHTIVVACTATALTSYLTDFLALWIPNHPATRVRLVEDTPARTRQRLFDLECDAAIAAPPLPPEIESLPITSVAVNALVPRGHDLDVAGPLEVSELHQVPILVMGDHYRSTKLLRSACRMAQVEPQIIFECSVGSTVAALARAGVGVGIISEAVTRPMPDELVERPLQHEGRPLAFGLDINWVRDRPLHPAARAFVHDLSDFMRPRRERSAG